MRRLFDTSKYTDLIEKDRARLVYGLTTFMVAVYTLFVLAVRTSGSAENILSLLITDAIFYAIGIGSLLATRTGRINLGALGPLAMVFVGGVVSSAQLGFASSSSGITLPIFVMLAGLLYRERGVVIGTVLAALALFVGISERANLVASPPSEINTFDLLANTLALGVIGLFTYLFVRGTRLSRIEGASTVAEERLKLAQITSQTAQRISKRMALDEVLTSAVEQIRTSYPDIYHAQIFMVDASGQEARLVASTGEIGKLLMQRQHSLGVGSLSVIGQVTLAGEPLVARAGSPDSIHRRNEALPDTAVEAAFPLRIGDKVIGALDLQSRNSSTFHDDDIPAFQSLADHIAVAIDNARLFEETSERLRENQQLVEQARNAVREVERLNRQLTGRAWSEYLRSKGDQLGLSVDFTDNSVKQDNTWTPTISEAIQYNYVAQAQQEDAQIIAIPLRVRGQVIGAIEFELDKDTSLSPEDLILVQEVGERLGLAAETTRLFERSQRIAQREALVNEIGTRLQATSNIEATLAEAARSLKQTLRADKVAIRLGTPPATNGGSET